VAPRAWVLGVAATTLAACLTAVALAAFGVRAVWFSAPEAWARVLAFDEGGVSWSGRLQIGGTFGHKNILAGYLVLAVPVLLAGCSGFVRARGPRLVALAALAAAGATLALTDALFGIVAAAFAAILLGLGLARARERSLGARRVLGGLAAACVVVAALGAGLLATGRLGALGAQRDGGSLAARAYLWDEGRRLVAERPWGGIGRSDFADHVDGGFPHAHNLYLMKFVESGVAGGVLFAALTALCLAGALRALFGPNPEGGRAARLRMGFAAGFVAFALFSLTDYVYNEPPLTALFWLWAGLGGGPWEETTD
jgi:O-antigen ligase